MTVLQSLPITIQLPGERMAVLDALRRKRSLSDYTGDDVDDVSAENCVREAERLLREVKAWLKKNRVELLR